MNRRPQADRRGSWKFRDGDHAQAPISFSDDHYWYSHRREGYYLNFNPPGEHYSLGLHETEKAARATATAHRAALARGEIRPDGKPIDTPETASEHAMRLVREHRERKKAAS